MGLKPYQERVPVLELRAGDFLDQIDPMRLRGPRGGRYRYDGMLFRSKITECGLDTYGRFYIKTVADPFGIVLPGNLHDCGAQAVRRIRTEEAEGA